MLKLHTRHDSAFELKTDSTDLRSTLHDLAIGPARPGAVALLAPGRPVLGYDELGEQVRAIGRWLAADGISGNTRIAVALPNGPEAAVAVLGVASYATCAPLDPSATERELRASFEALGVDRVIVPAGGAESVRRAAGFVGLRCIDSRWDDTLPAGCFALDTNAAAQAPAARHRDDVALLLQTSGTTASPKRVPLTHAQICRSAANIAATLALTPADRCLNVMPLFHVHGLIGALFASLHAGGSVVCTPGLRDGRFAAWLQAFEPTWYTAVPAMHHAIVDELERETRAPPAHRLRFVRSASSPLPPRLACRLDAALGVPVIEAYGMTEAAHQVASNPLPPSPRIPGTVGIATGVDVAIIDATSGNAVAPRTAGEIVIRGETVIARYDGAPSAGDAWIDGWFRTGDQGWLDEQGYLRVTGRFKELINRGGEKVAPREVEAVLLEHDAVTDCVAFGVSHPTLGEDVMAAIVLARNTATDADSVRGWLFGRLADAKIPSRVIAVDALPKGPTGKLQRADVAERLAPRLATPFVAPGDATQTYVAAMYAQVLGIDRVGANDNFFALGGDSLRGGQLLARLQARFGASLTLATLFKWPTTRQLAEAIAGAAHDPHADLLPPLRRIEAPSEDETQALLRERASHAAATGHALIARSLRAHGVATVYGVPGVPVQGTFGACVREGLRAIGTRHQQAAVLMAAAHNYVAGRPVATALVSSGPAAANAVTGAMVARDNAWPLVLLVGSVPGEPRNYGYFTDLDAETLFRPVSKLSMTVERTSDIPAAIGQAFAVATRGRPGPVVVQVRADVLGGSAQASAVSAAVAAAHDDASTAIDPRLLDDAARWLAAAARPLLILGKGARWNDAYADVQKLVDALALPFVASPMARGFVADDHPCCCNAIGWAAQSEADVVLLLGARLDWTFRHGTSIAAHARLIQVDVDAGELGRNRAADLPIRGEIREFVRGLLARLPAGSSEAPGVARDAGWVEGLRRRRDSELRTRAADSAFGGRRIAPAQLARALGRVLPRDAVTVLDGNLILAECQRHIAAFEPVTRLTPGNNGCMGTGIPFAIGAKLARPSRPVVAVCGDFAFGVCGFELETAVRHQIPIVVVIANNDGNAGALREQEMFPAGHAERVSMFMPGIRYADVMRAFGGHAEHVAHAEDLEPALARALAASGPACVNVALDPHAPYPRE